MSESERPAGNANTPEAARRAIDHAIAFLRLTALELRRIAQRAPEVADQLGHVADQLETEANHLSRRI